MKKLNIRPFSTPLIIGAGIFSATTGLLMFFVSEDPFKFAHEIVGIGFAVAIVLHISTNWRPFQAVLFATRCHHHSIGFNDGRGYGDKHHNPQQG